MSFGGMKRGMKENGRDGERKVRKARGREGVKVGEDGGRVTTTRKGNWL